MITFAVVTFRIQGVHNYPDIKEGHTYLKYPHRHEFHFKVSVQQFHNNRDLEYLELKNILMDKIKESYPKVSGVDCVVDFGSSSCEDICFKVLETLNQHFSEASPQRSMRIEVYEDGENGCKLE